MKPSPTPSDAATRPKRWALLTTDIPSLLVWTGIGLMAFTWLAPWFFWAELLCHFRPHLAGGMLLACGWELIWRRWVPLLCGLVAILPTGWILCGYMVDFTGNRARDLPTTTSPIRIAMTNVLTSNDQHDLMIQWIESSSPDVAVFVEVDQDWLDSLEAIDSRYPNSHAHPRADNFGIAIYSRLPIVAHSVVPLGEESLPVTVTKIETPDGPITIVGVHVLPPFSEETWQARDQQLDQLAEEIAKLEGPVVVTGDFNATCWSPAYSRFLKRAMLRDAQKGFGWFGTWPVSLPLFRIPLDHFFCNQHLRVHRYRPGAPVGSDHLPIIAEFSIAR